jgi:hypothetical protein
MRTNKLVGNAVVTKTVTSERFAVEGEYVRLRMEGIYNFFLHDMTYLSLFSLSFIFLSFAFRHLMRVQKYLLQ